ncbi:MAG: hypothetical protein LC730_02795 [Acidobacteria bacterium]|nr:hypothetical protein [Acidobacteriota bacterium]
MQPKLFEKLVDSVEIDKVLLYALGDFQSRGKQLANRQLALDRLRGAFERAFERFGIGVISDRAITNELAKLGAAVVELPTFVAKHPYRVTINDETAEIAKVYYAGFSGRRASQSVPPAPAGG